MWDFDCGIIGGGPGGLVSALYLRRFERSVVLVNAGKPRAAWIPKTHNLLGFDRGISGPVLLKRLRRQVNSAGGARGTAPRGEMAWLRAVATVERFRDGFVILTEGGRRLKVRKVILATGIEDFQPALKNLRELRYSGLLRYCSICDGHEFKNEPVAVLARDESGVDRALFIRHWTDDLTLLVPRELKLSQTKLREIAQSQVKLKRSDGLNMEILHRPRRLLITTADHRPFEVSGAYIELGMRPHDRAYRHLDGLNKTKDGFPIADAEQRLSIPGLFAVGDCVSEVGQIAVAAGQAAVAATTLHNDLLEEGL